MTRANRLSFHLLMWGDTIMGLYSHAVLDFSSPINVCLGHQGCYLQAPYQILILRVTLYGPNKIQNTNIIHWVIVSRDETTWMLHLSSTVTDTVLLSVVSKTTNSFHTLSQSQWKKPTRKAHGGFTAKTINQMSVGHKTNYSYAKWRCMNRNTDWVRDLDSTAQFKSFTLI